MCCCGICSIIADYAAADQLVSSGLRDLGYDTIMVTCHGWQRDPKTNELRANPKTWPRGYKALVDYLHARGLKITAYASTGRFNCCPPFEGVMEPGSLHYEELDIETFAAWGVDSIGLDNCALPFSGPPPSTDHSIVEYRRFHQAWLKVNRSIALQIWDGGFGKPEAWAPGMGHFWRTGPDLGNRWDYDHETMGPGAVMLNCKPEYSIVICTCASMLHSGRRLNRCFEK